MPTKDYIKAAAHLVASQGTTNERSPRQLVGDVREQAVALKELLEGKGVDEYVNTAALLVAGENRRNKEPRDLASDVRQVAGELRDLLEKTGE